MIDPNFAANWEAKLENDATGRWQSLTWRLNGQGLPAALAGSPRSRALRAPRRSPAHSILLLSDMHVLEGELLATNILARPERAGGGLGLEVLVTAER